MKEAMEFEDFVKAESMFIHDFSRRSMGKTGKFKMAIIVIVVS